MGQLNTFDLTDWIEKYNLKTYFETGTGEGISLQYASNYNDFDKLYSVDIDGGLIDSAKNKFIGNTKINLIHEYSTNAIKEVLPLLGANVNILFFLDAHFPGADFHKISYEESLRTFGKNSIPLQEELEIITSLKDVSNDVFVIDDLMLYESGDFESIRQGVVWKHAELQKELNLVTESKFIYDIFEKTHNLTKDFRHQGYLIITPKNY